MQGTKQLKKLQKKKKKKKKKVQANEEIMNSKKSALRGLLLSGLIADGKQGRILTLDHMHEEESTCTKWICIRIINEWVPQHEGREKDEERETGKRE